MLYINDGKLDISMLFQGDIIDNFPFFIFDNIDYIERENTGGDTYKIASDDGFEKNVSEDKVFALSKVKFVKIAILSHTCDAQRRDNIIIAPVFSLNELEVGNEKKTSIRSGKINYWFYLPSNNTSLKDEYIIDFQFIYYLPRSFVEKYKNNKIVSLSDFGIQSLDWSLSQFFSRPISEKHTGIDI